MIVKKRIIVNEQMITRVCRENGVIPLKAAENQTEMIISTGVIKTEFAWRIENVRKKGHNNISSTRVKHSKSNLILHSSEKL